MFSELLSFFGISSAYAANSPVAMQNNVASSLPIFIILIVAMYFLVIRPQTKRAKEHRLLVSNVKVGDEVIISGGILGRVTKLHENIACLEIANNVEIRIQKAAILTIIPHGSMKD